jgi:hypothetical protein
MSLAKSLAAKLKFFIHPAPRKNKTKNPQRFARGYWLGVIR